MNILWIFKASLPPQSIPSSFSLFPSNVLSLTALSCFFPPHWSNFESVPAVGQFSVCLLCCFDPCVLYSSFLWSSNFSTGVHVLLIYRCFLCILDILVPLLVICVTNILRLPYSCVFDDKKFKILSIQTSPLWLILFWVLCLKILLYSKFIKMFFYMVFWKSFGSRFYS